MRGKSRLAVTPMLAVLLTHREHPEERAWCQGLLDAMTKAGLINPE